MKKGVLDPAAQLLSNELTLLTTKWPLFETQSEACLGTRLAYHASTVDTQAWKKSQTKLHAKDN